MNKVLRYFAAHPTAANILMTAIILLGLAALPTLNRETFPQLKADLVSVSVPFPGATPSEVEEGICNRLEDATDGISFLKEQRCEARAGVGTLDAQMQEAGDIKQFKDDVQAAVDTITDFPAGVEDVTVRELGRVDAVLVMAIRSKLSPAELKTLAEYYRSKLLAIPQIPMVEVRGFSQHQYSVLLKPETLQKYKLSVQEVANLIRAQALDTPAGSVETAQNAYQIRFENLRRTPEELADLVILNSAGGGQVRLGDIAVIRDEFEDSDTYTTLNGEPAASLLISKNKTDDTLKVYQAVKQFIDEENKKLPEGTEIYITQDAASIVQDRLNLLLTNGWQGLLLATLVLFLFFTWRYTFWVALGLPISFLGGFALMSVLGVTINMISMVALLMAIGILMDDAIVISESIAHEYHTGKTPLQAAIDGVQKVGRGVFSSYLTSAFLFGSLLFMKGTIGQIMGVLPVVLLSVLTVSLIEAFLVLPHHLYHSLLKHHEQEPARWRKWFERQFEKLRDAVGQLADLSIRLRYIVVGGAIALFIISIGMMASGFVKFKGFPDIEGNRLEARLLLPPGTPHERTKQVVQTVLTALDKTVAELPAEAAGKQLVKTTQIDYGRNNDANETGSHLATIALDLLSAEERNNSLYTLKDQWAANIPAIADLVNLQLKEPAFGPGGQAISIRLQGDSLERLSQASWELQNWLAGYQGVSNIMDDLRPGTPQFRVTLLAGALNSGVDAQLLASQLRAAYQGVSVGEVYRGRESFEIAVKLDTDPQRALRDFKNLSIISKQGTPIPLSSIAAIEPKREFSRIMRINHERTVTVGADVNARIANAGEIIGHTMQTFIPTLKQRYPTLIVGLEGESRSSAETGQSVLTGFVLGVAGVFLLLSLQFQNYREPVVVLLNIPLALIGVIWGHFLLGLNLSLPSMIGFVALAGVVVNNSILLVEFVKYNTTEGMSLHDSAVRAVRDRFRAMILTSITTVAGMVPLLSETSLQAQVLIPLVASVVFGMTSSTILVLFVLPAAYAIMEDFGFTELPQVMDMEKAA